MRKIYLFLVALTIAVATNAATLQLNNGKSLSDNITADNSDVFLDGGSVAVRFESENHLIHVELNKGELSSNNANSALVFVADETYYGLVLHVNGDCAIRSKETMAQAAIYISGGSFAIVSENPNTSSLDIVSHVVLVQLQNDASMIVGNMSDASFDINFTSKSETNVHPLILGAGSSGHEVNFMFANVNFKTEGSVITQDLTGLNAISKLSNGVTIKDDKTFWKDGSDCKENFSLISPLPILIGNTFLFEEDAADFKPSVLTKGKISFDKVSKTLTLEGADLKDCIWIGYDDAIIYLKGDNYVRNAGSGVDDRITFVGKKAKIQGEADAWLTLHCNNASSGIYAAAGLEIGDFKKLEVTGALNGLVGSGETNEANALKITTAPMSIYSSGAAIKDFETLTIEAVELQLPSNLEYTGQVLMNKDDATIVGTLSLSYPIYFDFCGVTVDGRNAADIKVPGAAGKASYNSATKTLTLNGFDDKGYGASTGVMATEAMTIKLIGENKLATSSSCIESYYDLTIEGPGKLIMTSEYSEAIRLGSTQTLTLRKNADIEATTDHADGVATDAIVNCVTGWDPETMMETPAEPSGDAAIMNINNSSLKVTTGTGYAAVKGFKQISFKDAAIVEPAGAYFDMFCVDGGSSEALCGIILEGNYVDNVTITRSGPIESVPTVKAAVTNKASQKLFINGHLYIRTADGKLYNASGLEVR